jgi:hypothetical protein
MLLEIKKWNSLILYRGSLGKRGPRPASRARSLAFLRPGRNLGLGQEFGHSLSPAWANFSPVIARRRSEGDRIRRSRVHIGGSKAQATAAQNPSFISIPLLPPFSQRHAKSIAAAPAAVHGGWKEEGLRRSPAPPCAPSPMRASTRVGTPPSKGCAAVSFEPEAAGVVARLLSHPPEPKSPAVMAAVEWRAWVGHSVPSLFFLPVSI